MAPTLCLFLVLCTTVSVYCADQELLQTLKSLEKNVDALKQTIRDKESACEARLGYLEREVATLTSENARNKLQMKYMTDVLNHVDHAKKSISRRALVGDGNVAFTAFLDHDVDHVGQTEVIQYNRVLLNYGNAYNNFSNVFTAPIDGVYSFSFFIGQRNTGEFRAYLVVNNQHQVDAAVDVFHSVQDSQGGNSANLLLNAGDTVFVKHSGGGTHVEGDDRLRTTSFSGFLLFPVESTSIVG